jgi:hypothetical protein
LADNTTLNLGTGGDVIRDLDRGTAKTQVVAIDGGGTFGEALVSQIKPMPVDVLSPGILEVLRAVLIELRVLNTLMISTTTLADNLDAIRSDENLTLKMNG